MKSEYWEDEVGLRYILPDILAGNQSENIKKIFGKKPRAQRGLHEARV